MKSSRLGLYYAILIIKHACACLNRLVFRAAWLPSCPCRTSLPNSAQLSYHGIMKKLLIASIAINSLLIALLVAQSAQAKTKTYDAVKLAEYSTCLQAIAYSTEGIREFQFRDVTLSLCKKYKP